MSKKLFGKLFVFLLVVGLLFAAVAPKQAQAAAPVTTAAELSAAIAGSETEITVMANISVGSVSGHAFSIPSGRTITLDLNGHEISAETSNGGVFYNLGSLTVVDNSVAKGGRIINTNTTQTTLGDAAKSAISNNGVLTVNAGVIVAGPASGHGSWGSANFNPAYGIDNLSGGDVIVNGATISGAYGLRNFANGNGTTITITNGTITGKTGIAMQSFGTNVGTLIINGNTTVTAEKSAIYAAGVTQYNQIVINGGTFSGEDDYGTVCVVDGTLDINGGTFTGRNNTYSLINYYAIVDVTAGTFYGDIWGGDSEPYTGYEGTGSTSFATSEGDCITIDGVIEGVVSGEELVNTCHVHNVTQDTYYTTIQGAIDVATAGDTIEVGAGTYPENIDVTKPVTLLGPNAGTPGNGTRVAEAVIQGTAASWVTLYVEPNVPGVTVKGFKFDGTNLDTSVYSAGVAGDSSNLTVQNNVFVNQNDVAIITSGVYTPDGGATWLYDKWLTDVLIKDNLIINDVASLSQYNYGIYIQSSLGSVTGNVVTNYRSGIQVQPYGNTPGGGIIEGNTFSAYKLGIYFNYAEHSTANWLFKDNIVTGLPLPAGQADTPWQGIRVETFSAGNVSFEENQVTFGTASSTEKYVYYENNVTGGTSSATPNWWGSIEGPAAGTFVGTADYIPWCGDAACTTLLPAVHNVTQNKYYSTIQAAIADADANDVLNLAAVTFNEVGQIVIDKNLTIVGAGEASTIIKPTANTGSSGDAGAFFLVNNDVTFNISQVTIDGQGFDIRQALRFNGSGVVDHVTIKNIVYPGYMGWGIAQGNTNTNARTLTVSNSTFTNFGRVGIQTMAGSAASVATITGNTITCNGTGDFLNYGIYVEGGSGATITGNTISNCGGSVDPWGSAAIAVGTYFAPGTKATITNNIISNSTTGIAVGYYETDTSVVAATGNQLLNNVYAITTSGPAVDGAPNWWGTAVGPQPSMYDGDVDVSSWCTDPGCLNIAYAAQVAIAPVTPVVCGNTLTSTINVNVTGVPTASPMQGYSFRLHFDTTKTSIADLGTDIVNGGFVTNGGILYTYWIDGSGNISTVPTSILEVVYTQVFPSTSTGDGTLASIKLTHLGVPGDIALSVSDVELSTRDGLIIPSEASTTATILTLQPAVLNTTMEPDAGYCDLASAVLAANPNDVLQLQANITIPTTVSINKSLTLDLNGKVASYTPVNGENYVLQVTTGGALTVKDSLTGGTIRAITGDGRGINVNGGSLLVNSGSIQGEYASVNVQTNSSMTLAGGSIGGVNGAIKYSGIGVTGSGATLTVTGGTIQSYDFGIYGNGNAENWGTTINIQGGEIISTGAVGEGIYHPQAGTLNISGGTITGHQGVEMRNGTLNVTGGTIHAIGNYVADPDLKGGYSTDTGDAIYVGTSGTGYGNVVVNISDDPLHPGYPVITSDNGFALREEVLEGVTFTNTQLINVTGGTFYGGIDAGEAGAVVKFDTVDPAILKLTGGLYNTDPADPIVYVYVPYGTIPEGSMFRIVGISLNVHDFYYNNNGILRGVSTDFTVTNFVIADANSVTVQLFSGAGTTESPWVLQQTNTLNTPAAFDVSLLSSSFDIFGTYVSNSWANTRATEYGQHVPPTRVLVTVVLPGGTLTGENLIPDFEYSLIQPSIVISDFGYWDQSGVRGLSAGVVATNFDFNQATDIKLELFAGTTRLQTNTAPTTSPLFTQHYTSISGPFDIWGTFNYAADGYWSNARESEYGQTLVPTKVVATVTLPGGVILTAERENPSGTRADILPGVSGLVTLQGILAPRAGVGITLTPVSGVTRTTSSIAALDINYGFTGVETLTYTFTTSQARYLNVTTASGKTFLVNRDLTLNPLRLFGGDVDQTNVINVNDASLVGDAWGSTANPEANINYDGIVNIQDLALVGGNFGLTSATAYATIWTPLQ